jgi:excisionase family DNA binding protein
MRRRTRRSWGTANDATLDKRGYRRLHPGGPLIVNDYTCQACGGTGVDIAKLEHDLQRQLRGDVPEGRLTLSLQEAADAIGRSIKTIRSYIDSGELPTVEIGRTRMIYRRDLEDFVLSRRTASSGGSQCHENAADEPPEPTPTVRARSTRGKGTTSGLRVLHSPRRTGG